MERIGIHLIAALSLATLIFTTAASYSPHEVPQPGARQADPEPWLYDLSLGLLAAYAFNFLVVVLPAKRKQESRFITLRTPLRIITNNGMDVIRDLERIARCPARRITEEHLKKVLTAINDNPHVKAHIAERLSQAESAYADIIPYAADLPLDLQECLQHENQNFLHMAFSEHKEAGYSSRVSVDELRQISERSTHAFTSLNEFALKRQHLGGWTASFLSYYKATESVRELVDKYTLRTRQKQMGKDRPRVSPIVYLFGIEANDPEFPYMNYPPTATDDEYVKGGSK
ncbi:hypothetical protein ASF72_01830 [Arthrobacter sp. Leaf141]|uniref:hypothetical protein n=1 Tax=Arthrobacter sp. Leaf141 TaxID=1736273 RepID=UPI0006F98E6C|nr:hypothetical protein [Arthrobacter sp. Leaf141]KQQ96421.1 hypothetical protein ASF72_01830 [Arthrobacter sp. Leaf141]